MIDQPWWERWPAVLEREEAALRNANIRWTRNEDAYSKGILRLDLVLPPELGAHEMFVVYPDVYPYFRFQVYAPGLNLPYHSNPFEHNLCLMGRRTHWWKLTDTAGEVIARQLPTLLKTAAATDAAEVLGLEEQQAEPFSDYYTYKPSMILVDGDWSVPKEHKRGYLEIGTSKNGEQLPDKLIRGAVLELRANNGDVLFSAEAALRNAFAGKRIEGRWVRVNSPLRQAHEGKFIEELLALDPELKDAKPNHVNDGWLRIWGVLFPEQTAHRKEGESWVFVCAVDVNRPTVPQPHFRQAATSRQNNRRGRR
jgi:hypothetical protein